MIRPAMERFANKVVLVTGGSRNTGLDIVARFVSEGAKVWMCGSSAASTAKGAAELAARGVTGVRAMACDISDAAQVTALFDAIAREEGRLDVLVNNAANQGLGQGGPLDVEPDAMRAVFETNVFGGFRVTREACRRFFSIQETHGCVVFLSSNTARRAIRGRTSYCASKGAINSLVRSLALDLGPLGIRVNCCAPGYIRTERWDSLDPSVIARRRRNCPIGREATGADIAAVVAFLASDDASNMSGEIVTVDAGCSCQHMPPDCDC